MSNNRRSLIGLAIAIVLPVFGLAWYAERIPGLNPLLGREGFWWGLVLIVLLYVRVVERRPLSTIGFKRLTGKSVLWGIAGGIAILTFAGLSIIILLPLLHLKQNAQALSALVAMPLWYKVAIVFRAAICEEVLFRGYGIERLQELSGSRFVAGLVTLALFTVGHLSHWGWAQLIVAGAAGLVLTVLYLWQRDLGANMIAHWITDAVGVLLQ